jgi:hypothetical protein
LNRIQFPSEQPQTATPIPAPKVEKLTKASLVFVSSGSGPRVTAQTSSSVQPVVLERNPEFMALPTGTRLIARLQTPVSSAVKTPVVAAIEYNYERDGEIVIPAGSKAFGELSQVNDQGYVGIQFHTIQMPDETTQKIEGHAVGLQYQPLRGQVTGRNTGKKFLVRSLTGIGTILAATVGVQSGTGVTDALSNNVLLREPRQALLNHFGSLFVLKSQQCDRCRLNVRAQRDPVYNAVSGIPSPVHTGAVQKHLDAQMDSLPRCCGAIADRELLDGYGTEGRGDDPACGS